MAKKTTTLDLLGSAGSSFGSQAFQKTLQKIGSKALKAVASVGISLGLDILALLLTSWLAKDEPEKPLRYSVLQDRINPARWAVGRKLRLAGQIVWGSVIYGPGSRGQETVPGDQFKYYDNHLRLVIVMSEAGDHGIEGLVDADGTRGSKGWMWADKRRYGLTKKAGTTNEWNGGPALRPYTGNDRGWPQPNVFRVREYLSGDGVVPSGIQIVAADEYKYIEPDDYSAYTGADILDDTASGSGEWLTQAEFHAKPDAFRQSAQRIGSRNQVPGQPGEFSKPIKISQEEWPWTANHKLTGKAYLVVDIIQPFNQEDDPEDDLFQQIPELEFLVAGIKFTWPGQTVPSASGNAAAQLYWYDTARMQIPPASIDRTMFDAAYARCEETITIADSAIPSSLADLKTIRTYKFGESSTVIESGESPKAVYARLRAKMAGWRFHWNGKVIYRAGKEETPKHVFADEDFVAAVECQPSPDIRSRFTRLTISLPQSERGGDFEEDSIVYDAGAAAITKAGRVRNLDVELDCCTNILDAGHKAAILYRQSQQSFSFTALVRRQPQAANLSLIPGDAVTVTLDELGLVSRKCIVQHNTFGPSFESIITFSRDEGGVYADTLTLPPVRDRRLEFVATRPGAFVTGLAADEIAYIQPGGSVAVRLDVTCDQTTAFTTHFRMREKVAPGERVKEWIRRASEAQQVSFPDVAVGRTYEISARHETSARNFGPLATVIERTISGDLTPPGAVTGISIASLAEGYEVQATLPADADAAYLAIYSGSGPDFTPDPASLVTTVAGPPGGVVLHQVIGQPASAVQYIKVLALDTSLNEGAPSRSISVTPTPALADGSRVHTGDGEPMDSLGSDGDMYVQTDGRLWAKRSGAWYYTGIDWTLEGEALLVFSVAATATVPAPLPPVTTEFTSAPDGTVAYNQATTQLWRKVGGTWTLIGTLRGTTLLVTDDPPATGNAGDKRIDGNGCIWERLPDGTEVFTGVCGEIDSPADHGGGICTVHAVQAWPPNATFGRTGDGAYTLSDGRYGVKGASGWPTNPTGDLGVPDGHTFQLLRLASVPSWPPFTGYALRKTIIILLPDNNAYRWRPARGDYVLIGNLCQAVPAVAQAPPTGLAWSNITQNANGSWNYTLSWSAPAGAVSYKVDLSPTTTLFTTETSTTNTSYRFTDMANLTSYIASVKAVNSDGDDSASAQLAATTGFTGVNIPGAATNFAASVQQSSGDTTFSWTLPTTNISYVTHGILEIRQGSSVYKQIRIAGRTTTSFLERAVPAGNYAASIVFYSQGGAGNSSNAVSFTVNQRGATSTFPPVENLRITAGPTVQALSDRVEFDLAWDRPTGATPTGYYWYVPGLTTPTRTTSRTIRYWISPSTSTNFRYQFAVEAEYTLARSIVRSVDMVRGTPSSASRPAATNLTFTASTTTNGTLTVGWTNPITSNRIIGQVVIIRSALGGAALRYAVINRGTGSLSTSRIFANLALRTYQIQVFEVYRNGLSPALQRNYTLRRAVTTPKPAAPTGLSITANANGTLTVRGPSSLPSGVNGIQYNIDAGTTGASTHGHVDRTAFPLTTPVLLPNHSYIVNVRYWAGPEGGRVYSDDTSLTASLGTPVVVTRPANPASIRATPSTATQGRVDFVGARATRATSYVLTYFLTSNPTASATRGTTTVRDPGSGTTVSFNVTSIANGAYTAQWVGRNAAGNSPTAATTRFTVSTLTPMTPDEPTPPPPSTPLGAIPWISSRNIRNAVGAHYIGIDWGTAPNAASYRYTIRRPEGNVNGTTTGKTLNITNVTAASRSATGLYGIQVQPVDSSGNIGTSIELTVTARLPTITQPIGAQAVPISVVFMLADPNPNREGNLTATMTVICGRVAGATTYEAEFKRAAPSTQSFSSYTYTLPAVHSPRMEATLPRETNVEFIVHVTGQTIESKVAMRTPGAGASARAGTSGASGAQSGGSHYIVAVLDGDALPDDVGEDGDTAEDDAGNNWQRDGGKWRKL